MGVRSWTETHAIFGGVSGCSYIRDYASKRACYERRVREMAREKSPRAVAFEIADRAQSDRALASFCHEALHPLGEKVGAAAVKAGVKRLPVIDDVDDNCLQGYTHGVVLGAYDSMPLNDLVATAGDVCVSRSIGTTPLDCLHAMGHLIFRRAHTIERAVVACHDMDISMLSRDQQIRTLRGVYGARWMMLAREECYKGVFMEHAFALLAGKNVNIVRASRDLCQGIRSNAATCGRYIPLTASLLGASTRSSIDVCADVDRSLMQPCAAGAGYVVARLKDCSQYVPEPYVQKCVDSWRLIRGIGQRTT